MRSCALVSLAIIALLLAGCGGGGGKGGTTESSVPTSTDSTRRTAAPPAATASSKNRDRRKGQSAASPKAAAGGHSHRDSPVGAAQFEQKGGDNSIQQSGSDASVTELRQAAAALHAYLDSRAAGEWGRACAHLAPAIVAQLSHLTASHRLPCATLLAGLSAGVPAAALREAAIAEVGALRVEGGRGFLLFHGAHGTPYFMPMASEGGEWKVAALVPSALD